MIVRLVSSCLVDRVGVEPTYLRLQGGEPARWPARNWCRWHGIEPATRCLRNSRSATELHRRI